MPLKPIELTGEQKEILFLPHTNPVSIKGIAGCGKTTVALYRAKHLIENYSDLYNENNVVIFTFNKALVKYMDALLKVIPGGYQKKSNIRLRVRPGMNIHVMNFHKWAYHFLHKKGIKLRTLKSSETHAFVNDSRNKYITHRIAQKSVEFFMDEISWIKGRLIKSEDEYIAIERKGRGTVDRVLRTDRPIIWKIYQDYIHSIKQKGYVDFDDYALLCLEYMNDNDRVFSHIIIDEAQDLSKAQLTVLGKLVLKETQSITIIADAAQRIFKTGFSWAETGIAIQGRKSVILTKNYRNTAEIAEAAYSLLRKDTETGDFTQGALDMQRHGPKPFWNHFYAQSDEYNFLIEKINYIKNNNPESSIVVLSRNSNELANISNKLYNEKTPFQFINDEFNDDFKDNQIYLCTMSSIKGLEFDYVFIMDLDDNIFPSKIGMDVADDKDIQIITERRLLYVCMTRAKEELYLCSINGASRFLSEIESDKLEFCDHPSNFTDDLPF